jgi:hypothetical protein
MPDPVVPAVRKPVLADQQPRAAASSSNPYRRALGTLAYVLGLLGLLITVISFASGAVAGLPIGLALALFGFLALLSWLITAALTHKG